MKIINIKKITHFFRNLPRRIASRAFLACLLFILLSIVLGIYIFYKHCILVEKVEPEIGEIPGQFDEKLWQEVLKEKEIQQQRFEIADIKVYPDLFR